MTDVHRSEPTWLRVPALNLGGVVNVVGEMAYQIALEQLGGGRSPFGTRVRLVTAVLISEPENQHDDKAIRVDVGGTAIGYVAREQTSIFHPIIERLGRAGREATCRAEICGGWDRGSGDTGYIGVRLLTGSRPTVWNGLWPFLPEVPWHEALPIVFLDGQREKLPARGKILVRLVNAGGGALAISLDEDWLGHVVGRADLACWIADIASRGLPCTANLRIHNGTPVIFVADPDQVGAALYALGPSDPWASTALRGSGRWICGGCGLVWRVSDASVHEHECPGCGSYYVCSV